MPTMKSFPTYEDALEASQFAIKAYTGSLEQRVRELSLGSPEKPRDLRRRRATLILESDQSFSLLHIEQPVLYDVQSKGGTVLAPTMIVNDTMLVEVSRRIENQKRKRNGKFVSNKTVPHYAVPIVWPDKHRTAPNIQELKYPERAYRPDRILSRFQQRLAIVPGVIAIGQEITIEQFDETAYPLRTVPNDDTYGAPLKKVNILAVESHVPTPIDLGTVIGMTLASVNF